MSHYNKWAGGGYYYSDWWKKKSKKEKEETKTSSSPSTTKSDLPTTTTTPYRGGSSYLSGIGDYDDYYDDDVVDYKDIYRSRYKSSLGYSSERLSSSTVWWKSGGYYGGYYDYSGSYTSGAYAGKASGDEFEKLKIFLNKAVKEARDLIVILDFPFRVKIHFTSISPTVSKDSKRVFVATKMLEDTDRSDEDKLTIFCGLAVHEASHLKFTTRKVIQTYINDQVKSLPEAEKRLLTTLIMMVEDERVEDALLKERPGYIEFIEKEKTYEYNRFVESAKGKSSKYSQFFLNLYKLIRFPENVDVDILNTYSSIYEEIGNAVTPLPESSKEVCIASRKVLDIIKDGFKVDEMDDEEKSQFYKDMLSIALSAEEGYEELLYGVDGDSLSTPSSRIAGNLEDGATAEVLSGLTDGEIFCGDDKDTFFSKAKEDFNKYMESYNRIKKYIPAIRKLVRGHDRNFEFCMYGCRSGLLDTNKLAEAYQGVPQVYVRKGKVTTSKTTVCILIDESGSMGHWSRYGELSRIDTARDTAILLNEALKGIAGVDLYIYGHTGDQVYSGATEISIYKEGRSTCPEHALGAIRAQCENRDGVAILEVAKRVRKFTQEPVLMFIISDGIPSAVSYRGYEARKDTAKRVQEVEKMGFNTLAITIEAYSEAKEMYPRNIDLSDNLEDFPKLLSRLIKDLIIKSKVTTVE
jgi:hypothetical protein